VASLSQSQCTSDRLASPRQDSKTTGVAAEAQCTQIIRWSPPTHSPDLNITLPETRPHPTGPLASNASAAAAACRIACGFSNFLGHVHHALGKWRSAPASHGDHSRQKLWTLETGVRLATGNIRSCRARLEDQGPRPKSRRQVLYGVSTVFWFSTDKSVVLLPLRGLSESSRCGSSYEQRKFAWSGCLAAPWLVPDWRGSLAPRLWSRSLTATPDSCSQAALNSRAVHQTIGQQGRPG
jgi:hypothetical protein